jgi:hypothetical protein
MEEVKIEEHIDYQFLEDSAVGLDGGISLRQLEHRLSQISLDIFRYDLDQEDSCLLKQE